MWRPHLNRKLFYMSRKILLGLLLVLIAVQFVRPERNTSETFITTNDISHTVAIPGDVHDIFRKKCYDCHSNNTSYPWYVNIQPVGWWMGGHIKEGKEELNFSEFKTYDKKKADHKLEEVYEEIVEGHMPIGSYTITHRDAEVTPEELEKIGSWLRSLGIHVKG